MKNDFTCLSIFVVLLLQTACSSEQFKRTTYQALHDRDLQQCREEGHQDCPRADTYSDYEIKRKKAQKDTN